MLFSFDEDNFLNAAETLHISQSSLTKHIQKLEKELNVSLFDRNSRKAVITEAGKYFYKEAVKILKQKEKIIYNLEKYKESEEIKLVFFLYLISIISTLFLKILKKIILI